MTFNKANQRFFDVQHEPLETLQPIGGYEDMPLLSLKLSVENLETIVPKTIHNAQIATERSAYPDNQLTQDQSAAICLYTMTWKQTDQSLSTQLNNALRSKDRSELIPYSFYLRLFLSALSKLKSVRKTVWRGVKADLSEEYPRGKTVTWWGFSSCVGSMDDIQSDKFVGKTGTRTIFEIECKTGKAINAHSYYHDINEILLLPSTELQVTDQIRSADGLCLIRLKEVNTSTQRTEQKAKSAPSSLSTRVATNFVGVQNSNSSFSSSTTNISRMQTKAVKKPTKPYENKLLKEMISEERKKQSVRFSKQFFNYDDMEIIAGELNSNKSWTIIYLWENCMNERHMNILMGGLKTNSTMMCLSLDRNLLGDDGASILASALKTNTHLRSIYLNDNRIGDEGAEELSQMLYVNRTLTHLELSSNTIGDRGVAALSNALKVNRYLRKLCLSENKITKVGAEYVGEMLKVNKTLTDLQLSSNAIGDDGVIRIVQALERNNNTLESLDISQTMMSADSMHNIEQMLKTNTVLKSLYVNNNHFGDYALMMMISALRQNTTLTTLDLSMNDLTEKSANKLAGLLQEKETPLTTLIISHNPLGDQGITSIATALANNTTLVELMVENVDMTNEGVRELATMLSLNEELRYLALNNNAIDTVGMELLSDALECNRSLEYLYLNNCDLNDKCVPLIIKMMKHSKTLKSIELVKNRLTEHGKMVLNEANTLNKTCSLYMEFTFH